MLTENDAVAPSFAVGLEGCAVIENVLKTVSATALVVASSAAPTALITQRYWSSLSVAYTVAAVVYDALVAPPIGFQLAPASSDFSHWYVTLGE